MNKSLKYPLSPVKEGWSLPSSEALKLILRELFIEGTSLPSLCERENLPLLLVVEGIQRLLPKEWTAYKSARADGVKEVIMEELLGRFKINMGHYFDDSGNFVGYSSLTEEQKNAIESIEHTDRGGVKLKLSSRKDCLSLLGKELGMFKNRVEHSGNINLTKLLDELEEDSTEHQ